MDERVRQAQSGDQQQARGEAIAKGWRVVVFANVSRTPFANNLEGPVKALAALAAVLVIDPLRFPGVRPNRGGGTPGGAGTRRGPGSCLPSAAGPLPWGRAFFPPE